MKDQEIARRLRGFDGVWRRVRAQNPAEAAEARGVTLMPRRRPSGCRRRCR